jgi:hypothetical protein
MTEEFLTLFYSKTMTFDRFLHKLWYLHFSMKHNANQVTDTDCDKLWKPRHITDILYSSYSKYYALSEYLAVNKGLQNIRHESVHKYDMVVYFHMERRCVTACMTAAHVTVRHMTRWTDMDIMPFIA